MKVASISEAKNNLSKLINGLAGGPVLILDRGRPVARLESAADMGAEMWDARLARLVRKGLVTPPNSATPLPKDFFERPLPKSPPGPSLLDYLLEEREQGR
ncbi:MAG: type II toxin-antitoxin system Phd/YefM family antitoxin [Terriglobales bacterium]